MSFVDWLIDTFLRSIWLMYIPPYLHTLISEKFNTILTKYYKIGAFDMKTQSPCNPIYVLENRHRRLNKLHSWAVWPDWLKFFRDCLLWAVFLNTEVAHMFNYLFPRHNLSIM
jgi:hypothetical protein